MFADEYWRKKYNLSTLKTIYVSGSILSDKIYNKAHTIFSDIPIYNVYGLSEAGPRVTAQKAECCKCNSVGKPIKGVEVAIVNEQGNCVDNGEYGIVHVKTHSMFNGYITGYPKHVSLREEWYNTGDIGYVDTNGELHIINRVDDVIIIDSHKVYPSEVEKQILEQNDVKECAVAKVEYNGNELIGCLYVSDEKINETIKEKLKTKLLTCEIPRVFVRCDELPKTKNGKVSMREVQNCLKKYKGQE
jgi:acyl-coenzyme A synthetase/AMP-(fatty) acid ligase